MPRGRTPEGEHTLTNAERQARYRARREADQPAPAVRYRRAVDRRSRSQRWNDLVAGLLALQAEYAAWYDVLPDSLRDTPTVDGGLNPRLSGGGAKTGTNFAAELLAARVRGDRSLSTPQAAGGGGQRPAFTGIYRPTKIGRRDRWRWQHRIFSYPEY